MPTVLMVLRGALQAWGPATRWEDRPTLAHPTKSGVVGLLANCLGADDGDTAVVAELASMVMGVRGDAPGVVVGDLQTAGGGTFPPSARAERAGGAPPAYGAPRKPEYRDGRLAAPAKTSERDRVMRDKQYLADAGFLVGLAHRDTRLCTRVQQALRRPARLPYLGRRSCPPGAPLDWAVVDDPPGVGRMPPWAGEVPLMPWATCTRPAVWWEDPAGLHAVPAPPTSYRRRDHRVVRLARSTVTPPGSELEGGDDEFDDYI